MGAFDDLPHKAQMRAEAETLKEVERHERTKLALEKSEDDLKEAHRKLVDLQAQLRGEKAACALAEEATDTERKARLQAEARCTVLAGEIKRANGVTHAAVKSVSCQDISRDRNGFMDGFRLKVER